MVAWVPKTDDERSLLMGMSERESDRSIAIIAATVLEDRLRIQNQGLLTLRPKSDHSPIYIGYF